MPLVKARIGAETLASLREKLERLKIPFGPLAKPDDLFDDPHLNQGERMLDVVLPTGAYAKLPGLPLDMDGRKPRLRRQPPVKGEHTREVLEESGYMPEEIDWLVKDGVAIVPESAQK